MEKHSNETTPPRSRLYSLVPLGLGTAWVESLTSYINRLAWTYRVSSRQLVRYEIVPRLSSPYRVYLYETSQMSFGRYKAMSVNGTGAAANDWSETLGQLTLRPDLQTLNLRRWGNHVPAMGLLRRFPAWCPQCYQEWRETEQSLYQPLLWMLRILQVCPLHQRRLQEACPKCSRFQSVIFLNTTHGYCTQCNAWLGAFSPEEEQVSDDELHWQQWIVKAFHEIHQASASTEMFAWEQIPLGLMACVSSCQSENQLARILGVDSSELYSWRAGKRMISFKSLLDLCYVLDVPPVQILQNNAAYLKATLQPRRKRPPRPSRTYRSYSSEDRERPLAYLKAVLENREPPLAVKQIADHLGICGRLLPRWFPQECRLVTMNYRAHLNQKAEQRRERIYSEVQEATMKLHAQGIYPSKSLVAKSIGYPSVFRIPKAKETRLATLLELGTEQLQ